MRIIKTRRGFVAHLGNATTLPASDRNSAARAAVALRAVLPILPEGARWNGRAWSL